MYKILVTGTFRRALTASLHGQLAAPEGCRKPVLGVCVVRLQHKPCSHTVYSFLRTQRLRQLLLRSPTERSGGHLVQSTWCLTSTETIRLIKDRGGGGVGYGGGGREREIIYLSLQSPPE